MIPRLQGWLERHFPTREMFAPLAAFLLRVAPAHEQKIEDFRRSQFGHFTIGMQVPALSSCRCMRCEGSGQAGDWVQWTNCLGRC